LLVDIASLSLREWEEIPPVTRLTNGMVVAALILLTDSASLPKNPSRQTNKMLVTECGASQLLQA
jgi:hypothetical protein